MSSFAFFNGMSELSGVCRMSWISRRRFHRLLKARHFRDSLPQIWRCHRYFSDWRRLLLAYTELRHLSGAESFRLRTPEKLYITAWEPVDVVTIFDVFCRPEYRVQPTDTLILDIGANIGAFTMYAAIKAPKATIIAYEPVSYVYERLVQQCDQGSLGARIKLVNAAVGKNDERRRILLGNNDAVSSLYSQPGFSPADEVDVLSINSVLESMKERVSLLKMDCEGAEWDILDALSEESIRNVDRVCLEYHLLGHHNWRHLLARIQGWDLLLEKHVRFHSTGIAWFERR